MPGVSLSRGAAQDVMGDGSAPDAVFLPTDIAVKRARITSHHVQRRPVSRSHSGALQAANLAVSPDPAVVCPGTHPSSCLFIIYTPGSVHEPYELDWTGSSTVVPCRMQVVFFRRSRGRRNATQRVISLCINGIQAEVLIVSNIVENGQSIGLGDAGKPREARINCF